MTGLERIAAVFRQNTPAFMPYVVLGYPTRAASLQIVRELVEAGADILELGVPFSDPLADGPVIQAATQRALENGMNLAECLAMARELRAEGIETPALFMGYLNPMLAYGLERLAGDAAAAGVDGFIVPDLPPEEADEVERLCLQHGLALVHFLAPTSTPERIAYVACRATGFIYLVSVAGVTGERAQLPPYLIDWVQRLRAATDTPLVVGFGISQAQQAAAVGRIADGVVVGSALVKRAGESPERVAALAREMKAALSACPCHAGE